MPKATNSARKVESPWQRLCLSSAQGKWVFFYFGDSIWRTNLNPNCEFEMATDLTSSSTSSSPLVAKILIDVYEYFLLLDEVKANQNRYDHLMAQREKKLKDQLETSQQQQGKRNCPKDGSSRNAANMFSLINIILNVSFDLLSFTKIRCLP